MKPPQGWRVLTLQTLAFVPFGLLGSFVGIYCSKYDIVRAPEPVAAVADAPKPVPSDPDEARTVTLDGRLVRAGGLAVLVPAGAGPHVADRHKDHRLVAPRYDVAIELDRLPPGAAVRVVGLLSVDRLTGDRFLVVYRVEK